MTRSKSFSLPYHYWVLGLKHDENDTPVTGTIMCRGTDFDQNREFKTEDYEGHSGVKGLILQSDRTSITTEPEFQHGVVFGECQEEYWYLLLGTIVNNAPTEITLDNTKKAYKWIFNQDVANPKPLPVCTICNGYSMTTKDAVVFDNCKINEFEFKLEEKGVTNKIKFMSDAPYRNQPNQPKLVADALRKLGKEHINVYIAPVDTELTDANKDQFKYDCMLSHDLTFKTNLKESSCLNTEFGKSPADEGKFEGSAKFEVKWNENSKKLEDEYYSGAVNGVRPTTDPLFKQVLIECQGSKLGTQTTGTGDQAVITPVYCQLNIHMPKVEITKAETQLSGSDSKTIEGEYKIVENGTTSAVETTIISSLAELHYGTDLTITENA